MSEFKVNEKLKNQIYNKISYTDMDYSSILNSIIKMFSPDSGEPISYSWDNLSEADPLMIILHLMAAHIDILNYMVDYRVRENYMSTALERSSIVRIANGIGFKIPSYFPTVANFKVRDVPESLNEEHNELLKIEIHNGEVLQTPDEHLWTYIGETKQIQKGDTLQFIQGVVNQVSFKTNQIEKTKKTFIIPSANNVAIRPNKNAVVTSSLHIGNEGNKTTYTEIDSIYSYTGSNPYVYELNVDTYNITYIKFLDTFEVPDNGEDAVLEYFVTEGKLDTDISNAMTLTRTLDLTGAGEAGINLTDGRTVSGEFIEDIILELDTFTHGRDPMSVEEIKQQYKRGTTSPSSLITVKDFHDYVKSNGNDGLKVLAHDSNTAYNEIIGYRDITETPTTTVVIYVNDLNLNTLDLNDFKYLVSPTVTVDLKEATAVNITITGTNLTQTAKDYITEYLNYKQISENVTVTELNNVLARSNLNLTNEMGITNITGNIIGINNIIGEVSFNWGD